MWAFFEKLLSLLAPLFVGILSYSGGRESVKKDIKEEALRQAELGKKIDEEISASYSDPIARNKLRDKWRR